MKHLRYWLVPLWLVASACESPSDVLPGPGDWVPGSSRFGVRLTVASERDVVRGALPDGRIVFQTRNLAPFGSDWIVASIHPDTGPAREEAAVYRQAFSADVGSLVSTDDRRVLATWTRSLQGLDGCPAPAPAPPEVLGITLYELGPADGTPVASLPNRSAGTGAVTGSGTTNQRVRVTPALREMDASGGNPFGPALARQGSIIYSDGDSLWLTSLGAGTDPEFLGLGAYPAVSPDQKLLALARPVSVDSVVDTIVVPVGIAVCVQEHVEVTSAGWEVVVLDLDSGSETVLGPGLEPVFDPLAARLLARDGGLVWYELGSGARTEVPGSAGSFAPAITAGGSIMAFSRSDDGNTDVFAAPISR